MAEWVVHHNGKLINHNRYTTDNVLSINMELSSYKINKTPKVILGAELLYFTLGNVAKLTPFSFLLL